MNGGKLPLIERLFRRHRPALLAFIHRRITAKADAADLAQEVYLRLLRARNLEQIRNPEAYLFTVANNLVKEHSVIERRYAAEHEILEFAMPEQLVEQPRHDAQIDTELREARLRAVLACLPERRRAALLLQYQHDMTYKDIARTLGVSPSMVKKYLVKGLAQCRDELADWD